MDVRFFIEDGVERVEIRTGYDGKDIINRPASAADVAAHRREYAAFRGPVVKSVAKAQKKAE
jgi:hypothetical protein